MQYNLWLKLAVCVCVLTINLVTSDDILAWQTPAGGVNHDFVSKAHGLQLDRTGRASLSCSAQSTWRFSDLLIGETAWNLMYTTQNNGNTSFLQYSPLTCPESAFRIFTGQPFTVALTPAKSYYFLLSSLNRQNSTIDFQLRNVFGSVYSVTSLSLALNETEDEEGEEEVAVEEEEEAGRRTSEVSLTSVFVCSSVALVELNVNTSRFHFLFSLKQSSSEYPLARRIPTLPFSIADSTAYSIFPANKPTLHFNDTICSFNIATVQLLTESENATVNSWQVQLSSSLTSYYTHLWSTPLNVNFTMNDDDTDSANTTNNLRRQIMYHTILDKMMVLTGDGQVHIINPNTGDLIQASLKYNNPQQIAGSRSAHFWVIDSVGLHRVTYNLATFHSRLERQSYSPYTSLVLDWAGYLYLTTASTLYVITPSNRLALVWSQYGMTLAIPVDQSSAIVLSNFGRQISTIKWDTSNTPTQAPTPYPYPTYPYPTRPYYPPTPYYPSSSSSRSTLYIVVSVLGAVALILKLTYFACRRRGATSTPQGSDYVRVDNGNDVYSPLSPPPAENQTSSSLPPSSLVPPDYSFVVDPARLVKSDLPASTSK